MAKPSLNKHDQKRDKLYSAYLYEGDGKWRKDVCLRRGKKTGNCYEWKHEYLDQSKPEDEAFIKSSMLLIGEGEL